MIFPSVGFNSPNINLNNVIFPVPLSPDKRIFSPDLIVISGYETTSPLLKCSWSLTIDSFAKLAILF